MILYDLKLTQYEILEFQISYLVFLLKELHTEFCDTKTAQYKILIYVHSLMEIHYNNTP